MDSVLDDLTVVTTKVINDKLGTSYTKADIDVWMFIEKLGLAGKITYNEVFEASWKRWEEIPATEAGLDKTVLELRKLGMVDVVTAAGGYESEKERKQWLVKHGITYNSFVVVPMHLKTDGGSAKLEMDYDVWIDDNPSDAVAAIKQGKRLLLYDQAWNRNIDTPTRTVVRIKTLKQAVPIVRGRGGFRGFPRIG